MHRSFHVSSLAAVTALGLSFSPVPELGPTPAEAQWWNAAPPPSYRPRVHVNRAAVPRRDVNRVTRSSGNPTKASTAEIEAAKQTINGPMIAVVSIGAQRMTVYDQGGAIIRTPVSTGKTGHPTPTGVFSVIQKNRHHRSNIYSGAPMPYMQRITWSGIALHAGVLPGYPASAGCIRLPYPVAARLFASSKMGMRVVVAQSEAQVDTFAHPALPEPLMVAVPVGSDQDRRADGSQSTESVRVAAAPGEGGPQVASRFLNPMQFAALERTRSKDRITEAIKANKELLDASLRASAEANAAITALRSSQAAYDGLRDRGTPEQQADAERLLNEAKAVEAEKSKAAFAAARASRDAEEAQVKAEEAARIAERGTEPIAVFISRKEGKVFVRQGMVPLFEAPVTFKDPARPLGTHVYQAMTADNATGRIGWKVITVPERVGGSTDSLANRGPVRRGEHAAPVDLGPPSDARAALERVEMSAEVRKRISERLWLNGSLTVSDHGISNETGKGTDFIVLTR